MSRPWARVARMQCVIIGIIAARPGSILIRVSREMSFGPNTKPASRISESREAAREFLGMQHRARGLDHRPDPDRKVGVDIAEAIGDGREVLHAGNLGNQDAVGPGLAGHGDVVDPPRRIQRVDADQDLALAETPGRDGLGDLVARQRLGLRRDGILEVEDDAVGGEVPRLFQRPRIRTGHEQQAAARADHGLVPFNSRSPRDSISAGAPKALFPTASYG